MLKKTITYENFNGETISEDFFFHLSKAELVELEMSHEGGLSAALERIVAAEDGKSIVAEFKNIILSAYGKKSDDGRQFVKNDALRQEFESTEAYSTLFMELVTDTDAAVEFINGVIPAGIPEEVAKVAGTDDKPAIAAVPEPRVITKAEVENMTLDELEKLWQQTVDGEVKLGFDESLVSLMREAVRRENI